MFIVELVGLVKKIRKAEKKQKKNLSFVQQQADLIFPSVKPCVALAPAGSQANASRKYGVTAIPRESMSQLRSAAYSSNVTDAFILRVYSSLRSCHNCCEAVLDESAAAFLSSA